MSQPSLFGPEPTPWEEADLADVRIAQVVFDLPVDSHFDYFVPDELRGKLQAGQRVKVPFGRGNRMAVGYCVNVFTPESPPGKLKPVLALIDKQPLLSVKMLELTKWIAERYLCAWGQVLETVIPAGVKKKAGTREVQVARLIERPADDPLPKVSPKQQTVLEALQAAGKPVRVDELKAQLACTAVPIHGLRDKKLIEIVSVRSTPDAPSLGPVEPPPKLTLNEDQQQALDRILATLRERKHTTFVLAGVTGSGKTEVYIRAIEEVVSYGRQAIVLVPEISLTPQTIRRFRSRFRSVAVLHSHLSDVERHQHWQQIAQGRVQVVVGARSAVFAPTPHLGLIIIDEEHENTFKQDSTPKYHAREVARRRAEIDGVPLVLGSATPSLESWLRAVEGQDELIRMPRRVEDLPLPPVRVIDTREDAQLVGGMASIGRALHQAIDVSLKAGGQVILFLNLRGYSPAVWCRACGNTLRCPNCDVSLTWHREQQKLLCHSCQFQRPPPSLCPHCEKPGLIFVGTGTQKLEHEVRARYPGVKILRMDSDSMKGPGSHDEALEAFRRGEVRILLGTQMIAKGLDFPNVTLVGVVDADTMLHQPDYRASERTFQLIAQVAGRTGRSSRGGRVLVQTANPTDHTIEWAAKHDYVSFAQAELLVRKHMQYPPFTHLVRVIVRGLDERQVQESTAFITSRCQDRAKANGFAIKILGPAPAPVTRLNNQFRYHLQLTSPDLSAIQKVWREVVPMLKLPREVEFTVDVDPLNLR